MKKRLKVRLIHEERDETILVPGDRTVIGRAESHLVSLADCGTVSRNHLEVRAHQNGLWVRDLDSANGSFLAGEPLPPNEWVRFEGQRLVVGDPDTGPEIRLEAVSVEPEAPPPRSRDTREVGKISERLELLKRELALRESERVAAEERQSVMVKRVEELIFREVELYKNIEQLKGRANEAIAECETIEQTLKDWELKKADAERALSEHEASIAGIQEFNRAEEQRLIQKRDELKTMAEAHAMELEHFEAEKKLKLTQVENQLEELRTKKLLIDRDLEARAAEIAFSEERIRQLKTEWDTLNETLSANRSEMRDIREELPKCKRELTDLETRLVGLREEAESARGRAGVILDSAKKEAKKTVDAAKAEKNLIERRAAEDAARAREALKAELEDARVRAEQEIWARRDEAIRERQEEQERHQREMEAADKARKEELRVARERGLEEVRGAIAAEFQKAREAITEQRELFAKRVVDTAVTTMEAAGETVPLNLISGLQLALNQSMEEYSKSEGFQVETFANSKKRFLRKASGWAVAAVAMVVFAVYGPEFIRQKLQVLRLEKAAENAQFMKEMREQRARMLALHLEVKREFQGTYVDNILYNPGYLALKQDEAMQKEWTGALSRFFFEQLLLDDQKVVAYLPVEAGMIRALSEVNQVLNTNNFSVNLAKMKGLEEARIADLWLAAGGKENWMKLRKFEADFYRARINEAGEPIRTPEARTPAGK